ncbi:hypothetical protein J8N05_41700 [Streptomyces sp. BH-SS-21]|uniref:Uncharacterized protein n=1 Tax=Streptomyces liliiviolaceus TaxID=2823109 RepID=A0A940Y344_9ACTN|nr:hypothetical protein [Streptomyces liliiviolaceus]MBQ0854678.1 hypothetical protein [Streptomyces liliiviolaceus]
MATDDPTDDEVHAAIDACRARIGFRRGSAPPVGDFRLTRLHLLEATITHHIENREQKPRHAPGIVDLSALPLYDNLKDYKLGPHESPRGRPLVLLQRGSAHLGPCNCGNGRRQCARCAGRTYWTCEPAKACPVCSGVSPCTQYVLHGNLPGTPSKLPKPGQPGERVTCQGCQTADSACPGCRGWGRVRCDDCGASGRIACEECGRKGTVECGTCTGSGHLTTWTEGRITWVPELDSVVPVQRPSRIKPALDSAGWRKEFLKADDPLPDDLSPAHRSALEPCLRPRDNEQDREATINRLTVVEARSSGSHHYQYYVFRGSDGRLKAEERISKDGRRMLWAVAAIAALILLAVLLTVA